jgi:hypothetical protein
LATHVDSRNINTSWVTPEKGTKVGFEEEYLNKDEKIVKTLF